MLIAWVAVVPFDPAPVNFVARGAHQFIEPLPEIDIFNRRLGRCFPAPGFPARDPLRDALEHILTVHMKRDVAGALERRQRFNHSQHLHAVVGGVEFATKKLFLGVWRLKQCAPATRARVALAGAVGVNSYRIQSTSLEFKFNLSLDLTGPA